MDDKRGLIISLNAALMVISLFAIAARLLTRTFLIKLVGIDDVLATLAFFLALALSSLYITSTKYGEGLHIQYLDPVDMPAYTQVIVFSGLFYSLCQMFIKLSYLALYLRLTPSEIFRLILYIFMALVSAFGIATSIISMLLCIPLAKLWNPDTPGNCVNINYYYITTTVLNIFFDLTIFLLPIPILWTLNLPRRQRIGLVVIFGIGSIVLLASIFRLVTLINLLSVPTYRSDNTWSTVNSLNWSAVEIHLALLISCTPAFKALIQRYLPDFLGNSRITAFLRSHRPNHSGVGGTYVLQSRSRGEPEFKTVIVANVNEVEETGSWEHIIEKREGIRYETAVSIHSSSKASIVDGVGGSLVNSA